MSHHFAVVYRGTSRLWPPSGRQGRPRPGADEQGWGGTAGRDAVEARHGVEAKDEVARGSLIEESGVPAHCSAEDCVVAKDSAIQGGLVDIWGGIERFQIRACYATSKMCWGRHRS